MVTENNNDRIHRIKRAVSTHAPVAPPSERLLESDSDTRTRGRAVENRQPLELIELRRAL